MNSEFFLKLHRWVHKAAAWNGIPFLLFFIALADFLILLIPSDLFLIAAVLGLQKRMPLFAASMVMGRVVAVVVAFYLALQVPISHLQGMTVKYGFEATWTTCQAFFEKFGPVSVAISGLTPLPMLFPAVMSTVAGAPLWQLVLFTFLGAAVRYALLCVAIVGGKELYLKYFIEKAD